MIPNSTYEKLILLAYKELSEEESLIVQSLIISDDQIRSAWSQIQGAIKELDQKSLEPSVEITKSILSQISSKHKKLA